MPRLLTLARAALFSAIFLSTTSAFATQVLLLSPEQMGSEADAVLRGRVESVRSYWNDARTRILTEIELQVEASYKGGFPSSVRVVQFGGSVDGVRMTAHGLPSWGQDEEVLVFLESSLPGRFRIAGFSQGKFSVERDEASGDLFVRRPALGVERLDGSGKRVASDGGMRLPLSDLLREALPGTPITEEGR